jgi:cold-inducible RNA-binding protein
MAQKLFVGGLPYRMGDDDLRELFAPHGTVESARVITDRETGRSKGFGFVEYTSDAEAEAAIKALNNTEIDGRRIVVNEAKPMAPRPPR